MLATLSRLPLSDLNRLNFSVSPIFSLFPEN
jgi:hypothetical protein